MPYQQHERERDQTHSYWYIPSAPRVNYSLLIMESAGMMKMATSDDSPLSQGAGTGSRLVFGGDKGLRRRNSRSRFLSGGFCIYRNFWRRSHVRGDLRVIHEVGPTLLLRGLLLVHKKSTKIGKSIGLRLVFLFCRTQKQGKQKLALGSR